MKKKQDNNKGGIIKLWDKVAPTFSKIGPRYWDNFGNRLVELASIKKGAKVLDIGSGRGSVLFPLIKKVGEHGSIIGIDISEVMIKESYKEIHQQGIQNVKLMTMDAETLNFIDNSFDNILGGFVISYLLFTDTKLNGVLRVLKEGGEVGFSIWGIQEDTKWIKGLFNTYLDLNPAFEDVKKNPKVIKFDTAESVRKILMEAGFKNIKVFEEKKVVIYKSKEEWWQEMWSNAIRRVLEQVREKGNDKLEYFKNDAFQGLENYRIGEEFHFNRAVIYAFGEK